MVCLNETFAMRSKLQGEIKVANFTFKFSSIREA